MRQTGSFLSTAITYDLGTHRRLPLAEDDANELRETKKPKDAVLQAWPPQAPQTVDQGRISL